METEKKTRNGEESIPHEIVFDILTRLTVKSLSRFRCVSKLCKSTISDHHFVKAHYNCSLTRSDGTTLLLTFSDRYGFSRSIYTADYREKAQKDPAPVDAVHHLTMSSGGAGVGMSVSDSLNGLIYLTLGSKLRICNPITREFITFPYPIRQTHFPPPFGGCAHHSSFGYDPINNQYKLLKTWAINTPSDLEYKIVMEHNVFVLGAHSWRRIGDGPPHHPYRESVCVSGTVYYRAWATIQKSSEVLVAFDVRLETFRFLQLPDGAPLDFRNSVLISYNGNVAIVDCGFLTNVGEIVLHMWVLEEDLLKPSWVHKIIVSPFDCTEIGEDHGFKVAGSNLAGEIILAPTGLHKPFYVFYLDVNSHSVRRVHIHNMPDQVLCRVGDITASDHAENILSLSNLKF